MLCELRVENLLLIERAELRLAAGLNVLTGETGAGKTVIFSHLARLARRQVLVLAHREELLTQTAAVFGIPHEVWGEAVHAICVVREGSATTAEDLISHARNSIAGYKVPRTVDLRTEPLPLSAAMKVLKRELRELDIR